MRTSLIALAIAALPALATTAIAQSPGDRARWEQAQRRFDNERAIYERERDRYEAARRGGRGGYGGGYGRGYGYGK